MSVLPAAYEPMLASLSEPPVAQQGLVYEPKYDGIRAIVEVRAGGGVTIYSRNGIDKTRQFPGIASALASLGKRLKATAVLDGEIVAVDKAGTPLGFQHIQGRIHLTGPAEIERGEERQPAVLIVFDILRDGLKDLRRLPLVERRLKLQERIQPRGKEETWLRLSEISLDDGREMLRRARDEGWEGLIVKEAHSPYHSGKRSPVWRKMKLLKQQEFVVGGWTAPRQTRSYFGSLLLGYYDDQGELRWAGSVGTGFDQKELDRVWKLLEPRKTDRSPFADNFKTAEKAAWLKPTLVVEVRFTEWTSDGLLRQPVYLGTREDKSARTVRREDERPKDAPALPANGRYKKNVRVRIEPGSVSSEKGTRLKKEPGSESEIRAIVARLRELEDTRKDGELALPNGDTLRVTNLSKVFWTALKVTKGDLLRYYAEVSPYLLPAVDDRPMVMKRFPNGVDKPAFYQQRHPETPPPGVRRVVLPEDVEPITEEGPRDRVIGGSLTTLLYMGQLAAISQDPWFSRVSDPWHQDHCAIDLDPGEGAGLDKVLDVARWVKEEMDRLGVPGFPKTSGSRGLHIYIPLPPKTTYESGQLLCHLIATLVCDKHPKVATIERMVKRRPRGTVYVDYLQNILGKTLATAYSVRASDYAGVSTPLRWTEVARGVDPRDYTIRTALQRFNEMADLWKELRTSRPVNLTAVLARAGRLTRG
jgi:bifunctional non-homologous end joining protein LigD